MGYVVNQLQAEFVGWRIEYVFEALAHPVGYGLSIREGIVDSACHGLIVVSSFFAGSGCTGELPIGQCDLVLVDGTLHDAQVIRADLVSESS